MRWQGRRTQNSLPSASTSKIHLHVGPFSLKRNWRLAERLLNTRGFKQDPLVGREEGRKSHQVGIYGPGRGIRGKARSPGQRPAWGVSNSSRRWGIPVLESYTEKTSPPRWLGGWLGRQGGLGKPGVASGWGRSGHHGLLLKEHSREVQNPDCNQPTPSTHAKSPRGPSCSTAGRGRRSLE